MLKRKLRYFVCALMLIFLYNFFGVGDYLYARSYDTDFDYPLKIDLKPVVEEMLLGNKPNVSPINNYPYKFLTYSGKCIAKRKPDLIIMIKSAIDHFGHRDAIRQTYGKENVFPGKNIRTVFFLGIDGEVPKSEIQELVEIEVDKYKDVIQMNFIDNYFNNTIKTMMTFRWAFEHCSASKFYLFTDDDMYISVKNLFYYLQNQTKNSNNASLERDKHMLAGYVFKSAPQRFKSSKWRVPLDEYPWDRWPPYVTAGAYVVSNLSMKSLYLGSFYVKHFRFDDIYLGIVAKKIGLEPVHCPEIYFYKKKYSKESYEHVIASHGYGNHEELINVWRKQNQEQYLLSKSSSTPKSISSIKLVHFNGFEI